MAREKYVLVIPPCGFCWDRDGTEEVETIWDCAANLCPQCARLYQRPDSPARTLVLGADREPLITGTQAGAYVAEQTWTRAQPTFRGRPQAPHEYVLLWRSTDPWLQLRVLAYIRVNGVRRRWGPKWHTYWEHGEHEYWAMPPRETILNRRHQDW